MVFFWVVVVRSGPPFVGIPPVDKFDVFEWSCGDGDVFWFWRRRTRWIGGFRSVDFGLCFGWWWFVTLRTLVGRIVIISGVVLVVEVVIRMSLFAHPEEKGFRMEVVLDTSRRVCVF